MTTTTNNKNKLIKHLLDLALLAGAIWMMCWVSQDNGWVNFAMILVSITAGIKMALIGAMP